MATTVPVAADAAALQVVAACYPVESLVTEITEVGGDRWR